MAQTIQKAPGKIILFGEHAVVYGQPAIAVPIPQCYATVTIEPIIRGDESIQIIAPDIGINLPLSAVSEDFTIFIDLPLSKRARKPASSSPYEYPYPFNHPGCLRTGFRCSRIGCNDQGAMYLFRG